MKVFFSGSFSSATRSAARTMRSPQLSCGSVGRQVVVRVPQFC